MIWMSSAKGIYSVSSDETASVEFKCSSIFPSIWYISLWYN